MPLALKTCSMTAAREPHESSELFSSRCKRKLQLLLNAIHEMVVDHAVHIQAVTD